jgi:hypothetical protein
MALPSASVDGIVVVMWMGFDIICVSFCGRNKLRDASHLFASRLACEQEAAWKKRK